MNDDTSSPESTDWSFSPPQVAALLDAVVAVSREVRLEPVLRRVVDSACELVGARYGALGVLDAEHQGLADFLYVGVSEEEAEKIGDLPQGRGLLGELIHDPRPVRLTDLTADDRSCGFPAHHPAMSSFLGVPVRVRGEIFGNLYLTDKAGGGGFTMADEQLAVALAAVAGVAIENSRLHNRVGAYAVLEERERIARALHDTVIQRIFSIGLALDGIGRRLDDPESPVKLARAATDLDETVQQIRTTVFDLDLTNTDLRPVQREFTEFIDEVATRSGIAVSIRFDGDLDDLVGAGGRRDLADTLFEIARDAVVALREQHQRHRADLSISVSRQLTLHIGTDPIDGGVPDADWLDALESRARDLGGRSILRTDHSGLEIVWSVPVVP